MRARMISTANGAQDDRIDDVPVATHKAMTRQMTRILAHFDDPEVDEVVLQGAGATWAISARGVQPRPPVFGREEEFFDWLLDFAQARGTRLDPWQGSAGGELEDARYRWHAVLPPIARDGPVFCLRRHRFDALTLDDFGVKTPALMERLRAVVYARRALLIAGPTGSGKTSLLATLLKDMATSERLVILESLAELPLPSPFSIRLVERPADLDDRGAVGLPRLIAEALRLRPDRLVLGEIRAGEAAPFLEAMDSGHHGALATIHADDAMSARRRLVMLAKRGGLVGSMWRQRVDAIAVVVMARGRPPIIIDCDPGSG